MTIISRIQVYILFLKYSLQGIYATCGVFALNDKLGFNFACKEICQFMYLVKGVLNLQ